MTSSPIILSRSYEAEFVSVGMSSPYFKDRGLHFEHNTQSDSHFHPISQSFSSQPAHPSILHLSTTSSTKSQYPIYQSSDFISPPLPCSSLVLCTEALITVALFRYMTDMCTEIVIGGRIEDSRLKFHRLPNSPTARLGLWLVD